MFQELGVFLCIIRYADSVPPQQFQHSNFNFSKMVSISFMVQLGKSWEVVDDAIS